MTGTLRPEGASPALRAEHLTLARVVAHRAAWAALAGRPLEPNVFLDPDFAIALAEALPAALTPSFVLVWAGSGPGSALVALCPLTRRRRWHGAIAQTWLPDLAALGGILLDPSCAGPALRALFTFIAAGRGGCSGFILASIAADGPLFALLSDYAAALNYAIAPIGRWERAVLRAERPGAPSAAPGPSKRRAKEMARQRRRLAERGRLDYVTARGGAEMEAAIARFLHLEASGWKGAAGTALAADAARAAFARAMMQALATAGRCRIDALHLDDRPIAMGILLSSNDQDFFWKMAYAEDLAAYSPGVQFVADLTEAQRQDPRVRLTDSCAMPHHPMIDRLWPERRPLVDVALALRPGPAPFALKVAILLLRAARWLKAEIKRRRT